MRAAGTGSRGWGWALPEGNPRKMGWSDFPSVGGELRVEPGTADAEIRAVAERRVPQPLS